MNENLKMSTSMLDHTCRSTILSTVKNRQTFENAINLLLNEKKEFIVYLVDIDDFKLINEQHGYSYGDYFLTCLFEAFNNLLLSTYRLSGDQIALVEESSDLRSINDTITKIRGIVNNASESESINQSVTCSIGVLKCPEDGKTVESIERHIDIAINEAKAKGKNTDVIYTKSLKDKLDRIRGIELGVAHALQTDGFDLFLQPIFEMDDGIHKKYEVLLRWFSADNKGISIGEVIGVAEKSSQITEIDRYVIDKMFSIIMKYSRQEMFCINISAQSFYDDEFISFLEKKLSEYNVSPELIELEITEYSCVKDFEHTKENMQKIKSLGFRIALDDFGTEYSSLNYLGKLPFDALKIDKSYVDEICNPTDWIIVKHLIALANELKLDTIAEGIEHLDQKNILKDLGCKFGQGYLISKPQDYKVMLEINEDI